MSSQNEFRELTFERLFCLQRIEALKTGYPTQDRYILSFCAEAFSN